MAKQKQSLILPIFLIIGPTLAIVVALVLYVVINAIIAASTPAPDMSQNTDSQSLFGDDSSSGFRTVSNVLLYLVGAGSILAFVPCLVFGIIILSKRFAAR